MRPAETDRARYAIPRPANDSLWSIAQSQLGAGVLWLRIFVHNTRPEVVAVTHRALKTPNSLVIGELLLIPMPDRLNPRGRPGVHPAQTTHPSPTAATAKAATVASAPQPPVPSPSAHAAQSALAASGSGRINSFPFKYTLDKVPPIKLESAVAEIEVRFEGSVTIWADEQIPVLTYTNKGAELAAKQETDTALAKLLSDTQVSWDRATNKVEFENMLTIHAKGMPPSLTSIGVAAGSDSPMPSIRAKFTSPEMKGKYLKFLYVAPELQIIVDIRPKPQDPEITRQAQPSSSWSEAPLHFIAKYGLYVAAGVIATAVVASNVVTLGADTPLDVPAAAGVTGMLAAAAAM